ncbi:MAG: autotransporter outer membrane beta-barrel domain-containing protein [Tardiphaga sp.]
MPVIVARFIYGRLPFLIALQWFSQCCLTVCSNSRQKRSVPNYSARLEAGNRYATPWLGLALTPYAAVQVTYLDLPSYTEAAGAGTSSFALAYAAKGIASPRTELGLRSDRSFAVVDALLTLRGRAAWAHDTNTERSIAATFQSLPGASFVVNGARPASDAALTTAAAELRFVSGISIGATFEGEFSDVTRSYAGKGVVRYAW